MNYSCGLLVRFFFTTNYYSFIKKIAQATRIYLAIKLAITDIMLFGELLGRLNFKFSIVKIQPGKPSVEERNQKFLEDERSEYEPKAKRLLI